MTSSDVVGHVAVHVSVVLSTIITLHPVPSEPEVTIQLETRDQYDNTGASISTTGFDLCDDISIRATVTRQRSVRVRLTFTPDPSGYGNDQQYDTQTAQDLDEGKHFDNSVSKPKKQRILPPSESLVRSLNILCRDQSRLKCL